MIAPEKGYGKASVGSKKVQETLYFEARAITNSSIEP